MAFKRATSAVFVAYFGQTEASLFSDRVEHDAGLAERLAGQAAALARRLDSEKRFAELHAEQAAVVAERVKFETELADRLSRQASDLAARLSIELPNATNRFAEWPFSTQDLVDCLLERAVERLGTAFAHAFERLMKQAAIVAFFVGLAALGVSLFRRLDAALSSRGSTPVSQEEDQDVGPPQLQQVGPCPEFIAAASTQPVDACVEACATSATTSTLPQLEFDSAAAETTSAVACIELVSAAAATSAETCLELITPAQSAATVLPAAPTTSLLAMPETQRSAPSGRSRLASSDSESLETSDEEDAAESSAEEHSQVGEQRCIRRPPLQPVVSSLRHATASPRFAVPRLALPSVAATRTSVPCMEFAMEANVATSVVHRPEFVNAAAPASAVLAAVSSTPLLALPATPRAAMLETPRAVVLEAPLATVPETPRRVMRESPFQVMSEPSETQAPETLRAAMPETPRQAMPVTPRIVMPQTPRAMMTEAQRATMPGTPRTAMRETSGSSIPGTPRLANPGAARVITSETPRGAKPETPRVTIPVMFQPEMPDTVRAARYETPRLSTIGTPRSAKPEIPRLPLPGTQQVTLRETQQPSMKETPRAVMAEIPCERPNATPQSSPSDSGSSGTSEDEEPGPSMRCVQMGGTPRGANPGTPRMVMPEIRQAEMPDTVRAARYETPRLSTIETPRSTKTEIPRLSLPGTPRATVRETPRRSAMETPRTGMPETPRQIPAAAPQSSSSDSGSSGTSGDEDSSDEGSPMPSARCAIATSSQAADLPSALNAALSSHTSGCDASAVANDVDGSQTGEKEIKDDIEQEMIACPTVGDLVSERNVHEDLADAADWLADQAVALTDRLEQEMELAARLVEKASAAAAAVAVSAALVRRQSSKVGKDEHGPCGVNLASLAAAASAAAAAAQAAMAAEHRPLSEEGALRRVLTERKEAEVLNSIASLANVAEVERRACGSKFAPLAAAVSAAATAARAAVAAERRPLSAEVALLRELTEKKEAEVVNTISAAANVAEAMAEASVGAESDKESDAATQTRGNAETDVDAEVKVDADVNAETKVVADVEQDVETEAETDVEAEACVPHQNASHSGSPIVPTSSEAFAEAFADSWAEWLLPRGSSGWETSPRSSSCWSGDLGGATYVQDVAAQLSSGSNLVAGASLMAHEDMNHGVFDSIAELSEEEDEDSICETTSLISAGHLEEQQAEWDSVAAELEAKEKKHKGGNSVDEGGVDAVSSESGFTFGAGQSQQSTPLGTRELQSPPSLFSESCDVGVVGLEEEEVNSVQERNRVEVSGQPREQGVGTSTPSLAADEEIADRPDETEAATMDDTTSGGGSDLLEVEGLVGDNFGDDASEDSAASDEEDYAVAVVPQCANHEDDSFSRSISIPPVRLAGMQTAVLSSSSNSPSDQSSGACTAAAEASIVLQRETLEDELSAQRPFETTGERFAAILAAELERTPGSAASSDDLWEQQTDSIRSAGSSEAALVMSEAKSAHHAHKGEDHEDVRNTHDGIERVGCPPVVNLCSVSRALSFVSSTDVDSSVEVRTEDGIVSEEENGRRTPQRAGRRRFACPSGVSSDATWNELPREEEHTEAAPVAREHNGHGGWRPPLPTRTLAVSSETAAELVEKCRTPKDEAVREADEETASCFSTQASELFITDFQIEALLILGAGSDVMMDETDSLPSAGSFVLHVREHFPGDAGDEDSVAALMGCAEIPGMPHKHRAEEHVKQDNVGGKEQQKGQMAPEEAEENDNGGKKEDRLGKGDRRAEREENVATDGASLDAGEVMQEDEACIRQQDGKASIATTRADGGLDLAALSAESAAACATAAEVVARCICSTLRVVVLEAGADLMESQWDARSWWRRFMQSCEYSKSPALSSVSEGIRLRNHSGNDDMATAIVVRLAAFLVDGDNTVRRRCGTLRASPLHLELTNKAKCDALVPQPSPEEILASAESSPVPAVVTMQRSFRSEAVPASFVGDRVDVPKAAPEWVDEIADLIAIQAMEEMEEASVKASLEASAEQGAVTVKAAKASEETQVDRLEGKMLLRPLPSKGFSCSTATSEVEADPLLANKSRVEEATSALEAKPTQLRASTGAFSPRPVFMASQDLGAAVAEMKVAIDRALNSNDVNDEANTVESATEVQRNAVATVTEVKEAEKLKVETLSRRSVARSSTAIALSASLTAPLAPSASLSELALHPRPMKGDCGALHCSMPRRALGVAAAEVEDVAEPAPTSNAFDNVVLPLFSPSKESQEDLSLTSSDEADSDVERDELDDDLCIEVGAQASARHRRGAINQGAEAAPPWLPLGSPFLNSDCMTPLDSVASASSVPSSSPCSLVRRWRAPSLGASAASSSSAQLVPPLRWNHDTLSHSPSEASLPQVVRSRLPSAETNQSLVGGSCPSATHEQAAFEGWVPTPRRTVTPLRFGFVDAASELATAQGLPTPRSRLVQRVCFSDATMMLTPRAPKSVAVCADTDVHDAVAGVRLRRSLGDHSIQDVLQGVRLQGAAGSQDRMSDVASSVVDEADEVFEIDEADCDLAFEPRGAIDAPQSRREVALRLLGILQTEDQRRSAYEVTYGPCGSWDYPLSRGDKLSYLLMQYGVTSKRKPVA